MRRPYADYRGQGWDVAARTGRKRCLSLLDGSVHRRHRRSGWRWCFWPVVAIRCHRTFLAARRKRSNQTNQFRPRHHQVHLVQKHAFARPVGDQFKSGGGKAGLIHKRSVAQSAFCASGFADPPLPINQSKPTHKLGYGTRIPGARSVRKSTITSLGQREALLVA